VERCTRERGSERLTHELNDFVATRVADLLVPSMKVVAVHERAERWRLAGVRIALQRLVLPDAFHRRARSHHPRLVAIRHQMVE
jgi:hypothetical protein